MKKSFIYIFIGVVLITTLLPIAYVFWITGMLSMVTEILGPLFWIGVLAFILFIIAIIFIAMRLVKKYVQPKTLSNGLPATARVIQSYQGNKTIKVGVYQYYLLKIEVNVTNLQGETWQTTMEEMINITQVGMFQPDANFKVLYDPNNRDKVVFELSGQDGKAKKETFNQKYNIPGYGEVNSNMAQEAAQKQPLEIVLQMKAHKALYAELINRGLTSTAVVLKQDVVLENYISGVDAVRVKFRTDATGYETEQLIMSPKPSLYKSKVGKTIYVLYDPDNIKRVTISGLDTPNSTVSL